MRITLPVSGDILASGRWNARFPHLDFGDDILDDKGNLRVDRVAKILAGCGNIFRDSSSDTYNTYAMTVEFVQRLIHTTEAIEESDTNDAHISDDGSPEDRRLIRRMDRGQTANVRIDIRSLSDGVCFDVYPSNPKGTVIGQADTAARDFAIYCCRIIYTIYEDALAKDGGKFRIRLVSKVDPKIVEDAIRDELYGRACDRVRRFNSRRTLCMCCVGGFCSPAHPKCRFYKSGGFCKDLPLPERKSFAADDASLKKIVNSIIFDRCMKGGEK